MSPPQIPPRRPGSIPRIDPDEVRALSNRPVDIGDDREFILGELHKQTEYIVGKIDNLERSTDQRLLTLEKQQLEEGKTRVAVLELSGRVGALLDSERMQNQDIGAIKAAMMPAVKAEANSEGYLAGSAAGKHQGKLWSKVGVALAIIASSSVSYCMHQIENGAFSSPDHPPAAHP